MAVTIKLKNASGSDPSASDLVVGEVAIRTDNGKLFTKKDNGSVAEITGGGGIDDGDKGDITVSNSGATFTIDNGVIDNANIASNAAIAGSKIDPNFGSASVNTGHLIAATDGNTSISLQDTGHGFPSSEMKLTNGGRDLSITAPVDIRLLPQGGEKGVEIIGNGAVTLHFNDNPKIATTNTGVDVTGNIVVSGTVDGRDLATDGSKLDGIESGATADQSASEILTLIKTVDGAGSGLDADTLDGLNSSNFLRSNADDTMTGNLTISNSAPQIFLTDTNANDDFAIVVNGGSLRLRDETNSANRFVIDSDGNISAGGTITSTFQGNLTGNASGSSGSCTGNAATATKLANARTIAGVSFDGSANISLNNNAITNGAGYITSADGGNAATLDGIDSSQFVRADTSDSMLGDLTIGNGSAQTRLNIQKADNNVADHIKIFNGTTLTATIGVEDTSWLRLNQETSANIYTPNLIRADNGFQVDGVTVVDGSANVIGARVSGTVSNATRAENLGGASPSVGASNGTIVQRHSSGYIFANYFNTTPNDVSSGITKICVETGNDGYIRHGTAAAVRSFLNVANGATAGIATGSNASLNQLDITGNHGIDNEGWYRTDDSGEGAYNTATGQHWYSDHDDAWNVAGGGSANYIRFRDQNAGSIRGYVYANNSNQVGFLDQSGNWRLQVVSSSYTASSNHFYPSQNNTYSLGSSSLRWSDVFTADLHLSNEAKGGNDVDGSWGDWTLQEGEDTVYMLNNRNGKKFKMLLQEVS